MHLLAEKVLSLEKILGGVQVKITVNQMVGSMMIIISKGFPQKIDYYFFDPNFSYQKHQKSLKDIPRFRTSEYDGSKIDLSTTWRKLGSCKH